MGLMKGYIRIVDGFNRRIGRIVMYGIFVMMGILLWSTFSKVGSDLGFDINPSLWTLEMAQFAMVAYYILGGPYSIQLGSNVRMDLIYGELSNHRKAWVDSFSVLFLIFYLGILLWGGLESTQYSFKYGGERSPTAWRPYLWPIKVIMVTGIALMLLQAISELFKDILRIRDEEIA
ncbi:MAG: TRAP transporter small permease subunit [Marivivens sp.]|jgi:TRAP-type mannitol/chloroaromatic compound transport system permease small subunit|nr:TRAP transporter small permease subunit [Paracoccaceae bacterium]